MKFWLEIGVFFKELCIFAPDIHRIVVTILNELNDLIERLYAETFHEGGLQQQSANSVDTEAATTDSGEYVNRLRQVLDEMGAMLQTEDQPNMAETAPDEAACLRILNHWEQMMLSAAGHRQHMMSLERDIQKMQPWGNFDVMKVEQLASAGCQIRFWRIAAHLLPLRLAEGTWNCNNLKVVTQDLETAYFVTITTETETAPEPADAEEVDICPCPVSTLIMLQTRDKDSLRQLETLQGDYALCHYGEVYNALLELLPEGAPLPQLATEHTGLRQRLHALFSKHKG